MASPINPTKSNKCTCHGLQLAISSRRPMAKIPRGYGRTSGCDRGCASRAFGVGTLRLDAYAYVCIYIDQGLSYLEVNVGATLRRRLIHAKRDSNGFARQGRLRAGS